LFLKIIANPEVNLLAALSTTEVGQLKTETLIVPGGETISKVIGKLVELERYEAFIDCQGKIRVTSFRNILEAADLQQKACTTVSPIPLLDPKANLIAASNLMMNHRVRALPISFRRRDRWRNQEPLNNKESQGNHPVQRQCE